MLKLWEGLGYYSRARNLHKTAKYIVEKKNSVFPDNYKDLLKLNGIGPYTAAAIASIVYNEPVVALDGNVLRVASRLFLIKDAVDKPNTQKTIRSILMELMDIKSPGDFNQAMMELGAVICKPKNPNCQSCPVIIHCLANSNQLQHELPVKAGKIKIEQTYFNFLVPEFKGKTFITKRDSGIWVGLYQFPLIISKNRLLNQHEIEIQITDSGFSSISKLMASPIIKHVLTHKKITARFWTFDAGNYSGLESSLIINKKELKNYPMPQLMVNFIKDEKFN